MNKLCQKFYSLKLWFAQKTSIFVEFHAKAIDLYPNQCDNRLEENWSKDIAAVGDFMEFLIFIPSEYFKINEYELWFDVLI